MGVDEINIYDDGSVDDTREVGGYMKVHSRDDVVFVGYGSGGYGAVSVCFSMHRYAVVNT